MKAVVIFVALGATTWLPQVISQQGFFYKRDVIHAVRQGSLREYLPPSNTQKPRPFEPPLDNSHPPQTPDDENNIIGYPPTGSITPEPPFPFVTSPDAGTPTGNGYPGLDHDILPPDVSGYPPSGETPQPPFPTPAHPGTPGETHHEPDQPITPSPVYPTPTPESGSYPPGGYPVHPPEAPGSSVTPEEHSEYPLGPLPTPGDEHSTYPAPHTEEHTPYHETSPSTEEYGPPHETEKPAPSPGDETGEPGGKPEPEGPAPYPGTHTEEPSPDTEKPGPVPYPGSSQTDEPYNYPVPSIQPEEPGGTHETTEPAPHPEQPQTDEPVPYPHPTPQPEEPVPYPHPTPQPKEPVPYPHPTPQPEEPVPYPHPTPQPEEPVPYPHPTPQPEEPVPYPHPTPQPEQPVPYPQPTPQPEEPGKSEPETPGPSIPTEGPAPYPGPDVHETTPGEDDKPNGPPTEIPSHPPLIKTPSPAEERTTSPKEEVPPESIPSVGPPEPAASEPSPTFGPTDLVPTSGEPSSPIEPPDDDDLQHPPHIHNIDVECAKDMMTINIEFNRQFDGVIYSKGFYSQSECRYVNENSGQTKYSFTVSLDSCGTEFINAFDTQGQSYLENVLVLQNEPGIQEVWDTIRSVRCLWEGNLSKSLTVSLSVGMLTQEVVTFSGDTAMAMLDIQLGKGPFAPTANGLVKIGEPMTLVVSVTGDPGFDIHVRECKAKDNSGNSEVALTDSNGCVLKPKLFGAFQKTKDTGSTGASIIAYAFFNAFKFPDMMDLMIECEIDLCKTECDICTDPNQKHEPGRRRRRDVNQTLGEPMKIGKMLRVLVPSDLSDGETIVNIKDTEKLCVSVQGFVATAALLISLLTAMSLFSAYVWLQNQRFKFKK